MGPLLIYEKVIKSPSEWWRDHFYKAIHAEININNKTEAFLEWLRINYDTESLSELSDANLAQVYKSRKNKFLNPKIKENPRDFELRVAAFAEYLDEMERIGRFDRMKIPLTYSEILQELQASNRQLFCITDSTFGTFAKKAKKQLGFNLKQGARSKIK